MTRSPTISLVLICLLMLCPVQAQDERTPSGVVFTAEEQAWLEAHPVIRAANETDWPPFDFNEDGVPKGMVIDHMNLLAQKCGFELEYVSGRPWTELVGMFSEKQIDVMPVFYMNDERKPFTLYTKPYYKGKLGIFINVDNPDGADGLADRRVGMETSHGSIPLVRRTFPGVVITQVDSKAELVRMLATGRLDAILGNPFVFYQHARDNQVNNIRLHSYIETVQEDSGGPVFHIGVRHDWPLLHSILEKALADVSEAEMAAIRGKWVDTAIVRKLDWRIAAQSTCAVVAVILLLLWHNRRLRMMVESKTAELKRANEGLGEEVQKRTKELTDLNAELRQALDDLSTLHGILPVCSSCKKIRDDDGAWHTMETYVSAHSDAQFSHGLCPDCIRKVYPDDAGRIIARMDASGE